MKVKCWLCGNTYNVSLKGCTPKLKEAFALVYSQHPIKQFQEERIFAAKYWTDLARIMPLSPYYRNEAEIPRARELTKKQQARKDAALAFYEGEMERFKHRANGPESFPIEDVLSEIDREKISSIIPADIPATCHNDARAVVNDVNRFLLLLRKAAALERVIWDEVLPETEAEISFFEQERDQRIAVIVQANAEKEAEQERKRIAAMPKPIPPVPQIAPPPPPPVPVFELSPSDTLATANAPPADYWPIQLEEETALQRILRMAEEAKQREAKRELDRSRIPITLPQFR
jgi:hypothetical protein